MFEQEISVSMKPGSRVAVLTDVDTDEGGFTASTVFEDTVDRYIPETAKLEFENSDIGLAEFRDLLQEHDSVQVIKE